MANPFEPPRPSRGPVATRRSPPPPLPAPDRLPPWGWLEGFVVSQTALPALLFLPGIAPLRTPIRIAAYAMGLLAWAMIAGRGMSSARGDRFPARPWLLGCIAWLVLLIAHPSTYSIVTGIGQVLLYVAILSPAFWAGSLVRSPRQVDRLLAVLFLCNALSATVGLAQAFDPERFNPPEIPALKGQFQGEDVTYEVAGRRIIRPCGLTDTPGAAAPAGAAAALLGICWALRPVGVARRLGAAALAFAGVAVIYYTQVRLAMVMLVISFGVLTATWALRGEIRNALALAVGVVALIGGALVWVLAHGGATVVDRFATLVGDDPAKLYQNSRGTYVEEALFTTLPDNPLGLGLGWWGQIHASFGDPARPSLVWVEVMVPAWIVDGGLPLLLGYGVAVLLAVADTARVALRSRDRPLAFWAAVVLAQNLGVVASCFSYVVFLSPLGLSFWLLAALVHAADAQVRRRAALVRVGGG